MAAFGRRLLVELVRCCQQDVLQDVIERSGLQDTNLASLPQQRLCRCLAGFRIASVRGANLVRPRLA